MRSISLPNKQYEEAGDRIKFNRSGAVAVKFGAYHLDTVRSATGSSSLDAGLSQILQPVTANMNKRLPVVIVSSDPSSSYVAGETVRVWEGQGVKCRVKVNGSGTAIAAGDKLQLVDQSSTMVKATIGTHAAFAIAGAASTANGDIIDALLFTHGCPGLS